MLHLFTKLPELVHTLFGTVHTDTTDMIIANTVTVRMQISIVSITDNHAHVRSVLYHPGQHLLSVYHSLISTSTTIFINVSLDICLIAGVYLVQLNTDEESWTILYQHVNQSTHEMRYYAIEHNINAWQRK